LGEVISGALARALKSAERDAFFSVLRVALRR
jgi:hypothetical protein